jgi:glutamate-1-semialdehyde aminotransferase
MDVAQDSFISSTYWTERVGPAAAMATINKMRRRNVPAHLCRIGKLITEGWIKLAEDNGLRMNVMGIPSLATLKFDHGDINQALYTLFTQEMLKRGILASKSVYVSYSHTKEHVRRYLANVDAVFKLMAGAIEKADVREMLKGPVAHEGFKRLT